MRAKIVSDIFCRCEREEKRVRGDGVYAKGGGRAGEAG